MWENKHIKRTINRFLPGSEENILVLLTGARQTGKTTLLRLKYSDLPYFNLDAIEYRDQLKMISSFAWGREVGNALIDEVQKEPGLLDKIKFAFDNGSLRFSALSGSAQVLLLKHTRETLAGRISVLELFPLMLDELISFNEEKYNTILLEKLLECEDPDLLLSNHPAMLFGEGWDRATRAEDWLIKWGGMPALLHIRDETRRKDWLRDYSMTYLERDLGDLARITDLMPFRKFQQLAALRSGNLLSYSELARDAGIGIETTRRYMEYLRLSYQAVLIHPYHRNLTSSLIKTPKIYWLDNGLLRQMSGLGFNLISGHLFENYFAAEIIKYLRSVRSDAQLSFYRTRSGMEVDFCIETRGKLIGIEVKDRQTVVRSDHTALKKLQEASGNSWLCGMVVYRGNQIIKLDERIWAVPSCRLLSSSG